MSTVHDICTDLLPGLDEDIFEYIVGALEEFQKESDGDKEETATMVSSFLMSAEYLEDEDEAMEKANALVDKVVSSQGGDAPASSSLEVKVLSSEVKKLAIVDEVAPLIADSNKVNKNSLIDDDPTSEKNTKQAKKKAEQAQKKEERARKQGKLSAAEQAEAAAMEVEEELAAARIAAVKARSALGAYKGALDAKSFTLPNPGGGQPLLEDAACRLVWGKRYGLIGRNGMGKSTLLRAFAARQVGEIPVNVTVHYVSQEVNLTEEQRGKTPVECVVEADLERTLLLDELKGFEQLAAAGELDAKGSQRHGEVLSRLEEIDANSAERRAKGLLDNLGFSPELQARPLKELSGGWRVRTMLAAAIFAKPDLLLLDEPTNHLSILAVMWLARELSTSETWKQRIVVIVSHDRYFMDEVCTDCLHISGAARRMTQNKGNYSLWAKRRKDEQILFAKEQASRQAEIDTLREYAGHGFKYGGSSSQINKMGMKAKQAEKLERVQAEHALELAALQEDMELPINIAAGGEVDGYVVQLLDVGFGYPNATPARLFQHCDFGITSKSRIVLLGENGNGVGLTLILSMFGTILATIWMSLTFEIRCYRKRRW
jgi:ATP-binding cassette subfamily F protein 3